MLTCPGDRQAPACQYVGTFYTNLRCCCFNFSSTPSTLLLCLLFQQLNNRVAIRSVFPAICRQAYTWTNKKKIPFFFLNWSSEFLFGLSRYWNPLYVICVVKKLQGFILHCITVNRFGIYKGTIYFLKAKSNFSDMIAKIKCHEAISGKLNFLVRNLV